MEIEWEPKQLLQLLVVLGVGIASGVISTARYVYFLGDLKSRLPLRRQLQSGCSLALASGIIGIVSGAYFVEHQELFKSFAKATAVAMCVDPMNLTSMRRFLTVLIRSLSLIQTGLQNSPTQEEVDETRNDT